MAFNGSGTFNITSTGQPVVTGTVISSTAFNALTADLATGLSSVITKDGQTTTTGVIPFAQGIAVTGNATITGDLTVTGSLRAKTPVIDLADYLPAGNGVDDDLVPLTNFLNAVMASTNRIGIMGAKSYAISAALPQINVSGVKIIGSLPGLGSGNALANGTIIKKIGATANVDMLTIAPTADGSHYALTGIQFVGIGFDAGTSTGRARKCLIWKSASSSELEVRIGGEPSTCGVEIGCVSSLGNTPDPQRNRIRLYGFMVGDAGPLWIETGSTDRDVSKNYFEIIDAVHYNDYAGISGPGDNNRYGSVRLSQAGGGSASYAWNFLGNDIAAEAAQYSIVEDLESTVPIILRATGVTYPAKWIKVLNLARSNGTPDPVVEVGAVCRFEADNTPIFDGKVLTDSPAVTSDTDPPTTASATTRYQLVPNGVKILEITVTLTTLGPATGAIRVALPSGYSGRTGSLGKLSGGNVDTGLGCWGLIPTGGSYVRIVKAVDGSFPLANGQSLSVSGDYEITTTPA